MISFQNVCHEYRIFPLTDLLLEMFDNLNIYFISKEDRIERSM